MVNEIAADGTVTAGIIDWMFEVGIEVSEAMPILLFIGIGAMIDFGPLLSNPKLFLLGGAAPDGEDETPDMQVPDLHSLLEHFSSPEEGVRAV